jgi:DNA mismatch endonuclease (patch repair protein)
VVDELTPEHRSENMRRIKSKGMKSELAVRCLVHRMGFRFRLHSAELPGKPDLIFPRLKKAIEVRGCFWHQHKGCIDAHIPKSRVAYWRPKLRGNAQRDKRNVKKLRDLGWTVLVIWDCEVKASKQAKLRVRLRRFLKSD